MDLLPISFIAGVLTVLTPCVLPLLPVVIGGSLGEGKNTRKALVITGSLGVSVIIFTLLLKATTALIDISPDFWKALSGGIVLIFGVFTLFPKIWEKISGLFKLSSTSDGLLFRSAQSGGKYTDVLIGVALGPVFSSCSPTYAIILATVLPQSFTVGFINLVVYTLGMSLMLLLIALGGQRVTSKLKWAVNPEGWFKKAVGVLLILVGLTVVTGQDKKIQAALLNDEFYDKLIRFETNLLEKSMDEDMEMEKKIISVSDGAFNSEGESTFEFNVNPPRPAAEIRGITHWINSNGETLADLKGKVVLIDFWTYSCINCIRTLPYLREWHEKYADDGLVILGLHAPEFAFEQKIENVENAVEDYGIEYPVGMDNDFATWEAYNNRYWPAKYFIDKNGQLRHTHFGEGKYSESEEVIVALLKEAGANDVNEEISKEGDAPPISRFQTHETYLGFWRAENFANAIEFKPSQTVDYTEPTELSANEWGLGGPWRMDEKDLYSMGEASTLVLNFSAKDVYLVMGTEDGEARKVEVFVNGEKYIPEVVGDTSADEDGFINVTEPGLYKVVGLEQFESNQKLKLVVPDGVSLNAFTFGS